MQASEIKAPAEVASAANVLVWGALAVALAAVIGSLSLTWGLNLKACPLCFYQRTLVMSVMAVLGTGLLLGAASAGRLALLTMPLATAGMGIALFHVNLELSGKLECPGGLFDIGTAPQQSLAAFAVLFLLLLLGTLTADLPSGKKWAGLSGTVIVGVVLAAASCTSNPPMPSPPQRPYPQPPDVCRPPYRPSPGI